MSTRIVALVALCALPAAAHPLCTAKPMQLGLK